MKYLLLIITLLSTIQVNSQIFPAKFRIRFADKDGSPYSLNAPSKFLSEKAIERRKKQHIVLSENDIPVNPFYLDSLKKTGAVILNYSKWFNSALILIHDSSSFVHIRSFSFISGIDTLVKNFEGLKKSPIVHVQKEKLFYEHSNSFISEKNYFDNKGENMTNELKNKYGASFEQIQMLGGIRLHQANYKGENMIIALLDAGFLNVDKLHTFDSLWLTKRILGTKNFVDTSGNVFTTGSHGMYVLSLIGGNKPGIFIGTAPKASFWLLRTEDADTENIIEEDNWVAGAEFADSVGADIISSSLGYTVFDDSLQNHTYSQMDGHTARASIGANIAASKGILVVNSAGNSAQKPFKHIGAPADADSVLAVGATDFKGVHAKFSSIGPSADGRIKPDISAPGVEDAIIGLNDSITFGSGTSFAGPLISGLSACLWQSRPDLSNMQLMNMIKKSADKYYNPDELYGYGVPNFTVALMNLQSSTDEKKISLYPNPFKEKLNVIFYNSEDSQKVNIEVYALNSIKLYSFEKLSVKGYNYLSLYNLNTLQPGFYILRIITEDQVFTAKLIKQ